MLMDKKSQSDSCPLLFVFKHDFMNQLFEYKVFVDLGVVFKSRTKYNTTLTVKDTMKLCNATDNI
jgi:hypothetical protein